MRKTNTPGNTGNPRIQPTTAELAESFREFSRNQLLTVLTSTRVLRTQLALMDADGVLTQLPEDGRIQIYEQLAQCLAYFQPPVAAFDPRGGPRE